MLISFLHASLIIPVFFLSFLFAGIFLESSIILDFIPNIFRFIFNNFSHISLIRDSLESVDKIVQFLFYTKIRNQTGTISYVLRDKKILSFMIFSFYLLIFYYSVILLLFIGNLIRQKKDKNMKFFKGLYERLKNLKEEQPIKKEISERRMAELGSKVFKERNYGAFLKKRVFKAVQFSTFLIAQSFMILIFSYIQKLNVNYLLKYTLIIWPIIFYRFFSEIISTKIGDHYFINLFSVIKFNTFFINFFFDSVIFSASLMMFSNSFFKIQLFDLNWMKFVEKFSLF